MNHTPTPDGDQLGEYREYLMTVAALQLEPELRRKLDASDIVQQSLLEAYTERDRFAGQSRGEMAAWLKRILLNNLMDAIRGFRRARRDVSREQSLDASVHRSSVRLEQALAADQTSPGDAVVREERALRLSEAINGLPDAQREALVLQYWHGWPVAQIAEHMGRSRTAVAGLLKRAMRALRDDFDNSQAS